MNHISRNVARGYLPQSEINYFSQDVARGCLPKQKMNYISCDVARGYLSQSEMNYSILAVTSVAEPVHFWLTPAPSIFSPALAPAPVPAPIKKKAFNH